MAHHTMKIWPEYLDALADGTKRCWRYSMTLSRSRRRPLRGTELVRWLRRELRFLRAFVVAVFGHPTKSSVVTIDGDDVTVRHTVSTGVSAKDNNE